MQFSRRFKQLCTEKNVTQKQALIDMGMGRNAVQNWTSGRPSVDTLQKLAEYFGMSTDEVLGIETKKTPTLEGERDLSSLIEAFENADVSTREAILLLLKLK